MTKQKFDELYNNTILQLKNEIDSENIVRLKPFSNRQIFNKYQNIRSKLKAFLMENSEENIDRHKIASAMMCAIVDIYPCYIPLALRLKMFFKKETFSLDIAYINEYIAIYTALSILDNFYKQDVKDNQLDKRRHKIYIPTTFKDDYGYIFNMCIDLRYAKIKNKMNILTYSNAFFLLEYQHPFN